MIKTPEQILEEIFPPEPEPEPIRREVTPEQAKLHASRQADFAAVQPFIARFIEYMTNDLSTDQEHIGPELDREYLELTQSQKDTVVGILFSLLVKGKLRSKTCKK